MPDFDSPNRRLNDLLRDPREDLDVELKGWLDIVNSNDDKAVLAKAIIALANHGGGVILVGFSETDDGAVEAENRPENLSGYTPDSVNSVVHKYIEPPIHCDVQKIESPLDGKEYPIVVVPGGHRIPIRSRKGSPDGTTLKNNVYYIRRAGPQSAPPQNGHEWDILIERCVANGQENLIARLMQHLLQLQTQQRPTRESSEQASEDSGSSLVNFTLSTEYRQNEAERESQWKEESIERWRAKIAELEEDHPARFKHGYYAVSYKLISDDLEDRLNADADADFLEALRRGVVRYTGWPPFWLPTRDGIRPYFYENCVECWLGGEGNLQDAAHSDFWRASPDGNFFIIRGYQEDSFENEERQPGDSFDLTLPTWRIGEILLHASSMASQLEVPEARVVVDAEWTGLEGRELVAWASRDRLLVERVRSSQDRFQKTIEAQADLIPGILPDLVDNIVRPLYRLFEFFELPSDLTRQELDKMRQGHS